MSKQLKQLILAMAVLGILGIVSWNIDPFADFRRATKGDAVASQSPFAAYVVKNYRDCLHPGVFSSGSEGQCKVTIGQLVRLEKGDASVQEAMRVIDAYEQTKLQALGITSSKQ